VNGAQAVVGSGIYRPGHGTGTFVCARGGKQPGSYSAPSVIDPFLQIHGPAHTVRRLIGTCHCGGVDGCGTDLAQAVADVTDGELVTLKGQGPASSGIIEVG